MSRKGENIRKRKDGRWEGRFKNVFNKGKSKYSSVYGKTYTEVKEKLNAAKANSYHNKKKQSKVLFSEVIMMWYSSVEYKLKGATKNKYLNIISSHILPNIGNVRATDLTYDLVNTFIATKLNSGRLDGKGGLSSSYVRSIFLIVMSAISFGTKEFGISEIKHPVTKPQIYKKDVEILPLEDQKKLESYISNNFSPTGIGIMISLYTGMRIGEICALSWNDVDLNNNIIYIRHTVSRIKCIDGKKTKLILDSPKTNSSFRIIPIPSNLQSIIHQYRKISSSLYVASDCDTFISPRTYEYRYHRILDLANTKQVNYHTLRHTFATNCIEAGVDVKSLSEILGHSNVGITLNTYVHSSLNMKKIQLEKLTNLCKSIE